MQAGWLGARCDDADGCYNVNNWFVFVGGLRLLTRLLRLFAVCAMFMLIVCACSGGATSTCTDKPNPASGMIVCLCCCVRLA